MKPNELPEVFSRNLKAARQRAGMSQRKLAEITGCSFASVCRWETGRESPNLTTIVKLAEGLQVPPEALLTNFGFEMLQPISA
ncbi:helix-turn-helix domain protein [Planctopirus limnophila DSM 3776]|uniref:Helix-turn-helix domain protein n=1 Tax=Planctopirus limnophila (strain ATCC 43296 / DSM 3776 / IFAM 1008 / Mu 290) TaxID=521674 RepID=D5SMR3_PLAL2|nr:helix-turn-helix domain protein [Planctopirus limnophila DSM 3776]